MPRKDGANWGSGCDECGAGLRKIDLLTFTCQGTLKGSDEPCNRNRGPRRWIGEKQDHYRARFVEAQKELQKLQEQIKNARIEPIE